MRTPALSVAIVFALARAAIAGDPSLSADEARAEIASFIAVVWDIECGPQIPIKEYNFPVQAAAEGGYMYDQVRQLIAMKELEIIDWIDLESMLGMAHFRTELSAKVDRTQIVHVNPGYVCIKSVLSASSFEILKIDGVKGGTTINWDGAVVYATARHHFTPLMMKYREMLNEPDLSNARYRFLFRYDFFEQSWSSIAFDWSPLRSDFTSQMVPEALRQD